MTGRNDETPYEAAAQWHARIHADDMDWDAFARWLDADSAHQAAYDAIALIDDEVVRRAKEHDQAAANDTMPAVSRGHARRWWLAGTAAAAVLVAAVSIPVVMQSRPTPTVYYTATLDQKLVKLGDGNSARLDRGTRIAVAGDGGGRVRLEHGAAYFDVRHDPDRPFVVESGDFVIRDIGTRFEVARRAGQMSVAVAEGLVDISWRGRPATRLQAGQTFNASQENREAEIRKVDPDTVASWRDGRLIYDDAPLSLVAADISRYMAEPVHVDPSVADLKLSGILLIRDGSDLVDQIQAFLPVEARREDHHIRLVGKSSRR